MRIPCPLLYFLVLENVAKFAQTSVVIFAPDVSSNLTQYARAITRYVGSRVIFGSNDILGFRGILAFVGIAQAEKRGTVCLDGYAGSADIDPRGGE